MKLYCLLLNSEVRDLLKHDMKLFVGGGRLGFWNSVQFGFGGRGDGGDGVVGKGGGTPRREYWQNVEFYPYRLHIIFKQIIQQFPTVSKCVKLYS